MDTTTQREETYSLSSDEREELLDSELEELSSTLGGYQMNSKLKKAWISKVVPPSASQEDSPETDDIAIEFMLPSEDTFWETFNFPNKRWPEENEFRQFIESLGFYSPDSLPEIVGTEVDVEYDESMSRWSIQGDFQNSEEESESKDGFIDNLDPTQGGILLLSIVVGIPLSFILLVRLRHLSLPIILTGALGVYLVLKN